MDKGWIKLHRKLLDNPLIKKPAWFTIWVTLLLLANHDGNYQFVWNGKSIKLKQGEFVTGRKRLNEITGVSESTIERCLNYLETEQQIGQQKTTKYRLITILKWKDYQELDNKTDNRRTTDGHIQEHKNIRTDTILATNVAGFNPLGSEIIKAFEEVDPKNKTYYGNKTQRSACDYLLNEYGLEEILKRVSVLSRTNKLPYFPKINSPNDLKEKWVKLQDAVDTKKTELKNPSKNTPNYIL